MVADDVEPEGAVMDVGGMAAACLTKAAKADGMAGHGGGMPDEGCQGRRHGGAWRRHA